MVKTTNQWIIYGISIYIYIYLYKEPGISNHDQPLLTIINHY